MSTASKVLLVAVAAAAACGPNAGSKAYWIQSNTTARTYQEKQCNEGDDNACYYVGLDYVNYPTDSKHKDWEDHTYQLDRAKAKTLLERVCKSEATLKRNACGELVDSKLYTVDEALAECKSNGDICAAVALARDITLTDDQYFELCQEHPGDATCGMAQAHLVRDNARYAASMVTWKLESIRDHVSTNVKGDDDAPATSDNACHKDTDCKGDRICRAGDCVDAKAAAPAPKAPEGPFKQPDCDAFAALYSAHIESCAKATLGATDIKDDMASLQQQWKDLPKDRYDAAGAQCSAVVRELEPKLKRAGC